MLARPAPKIREFDGAPLDLKDIKGQESAKRALEIAAAGGHNLLMIGPPGAGKSMLAARLPSILPPLTPAELLDVSMIASVAGEIEGGALTNQRPFRAPHHSASMPALVGGGCARAAGRGLARPSRRAVSRRIAGIRPAGARCAAPAAGERRRVDRAGEPAHHLSGALHAGGAMNPCRCGRATEPGLHVPAHGRMRVARPNTRRGSPARCSTASICRSKCRR